MIFKLLRRIMNPSGTPAPSGPAPEDLTDVCSAQPGQEAPTAEEHEVRRLVEALYPELRRIAQAHMRWERQDHTWQPTALVSETFLKLAGQPGFRWRDRSHFLVAASKAMRLLLIDHARSHGAEKHGGKLSKIPLDDVQPPNQNPSMDYLEIHELLKKMAAVDRRMTAVVELKVFGGLTFVEIGQVLGINERTAKRDWQLARAWLYGAIRGSDDSRGVGTDQDTL